MHTGKTRLDGDRAGEPSGRTGRHEYFAGCSLMMKWLGRRARALIQQDLVTSLGTVIVVANSLRLLLRRRV